jgi:presenilin-like A22 family membrane protease
MVAARMAEERETETRMEHPNRKKAASKVTRLLVVLLLLISAGLVVIVTLGGWSSLAGAKAIQVAYIIVYVVLAFFVLRWSRGVLPLIAALAIGLLIFAAVSAPGWFDRAKPGFVDPGLPSDVLGLVCGIVVPVQLLLIAVAMSGFRQKWNIEVEADDGDDGDDRARGQRRNSGAGPSPAPA